MSRGTIFPPSPSNPLPIPRVGLPSGWLFTPLPDITPYELALCMTLLLRAVSRQVDSDTLAAAWHALPESAQRHWQPGGH